MFKGFTWKDWIIGYFTLGLWILYKMNKNGVPILKVAVGAIVIFVIVGVIAIATETPSDEFSRALKRNDVVRMEKISNENENLKIDGKKAEDIIAEVKAKQKAEAERIAKEKAEKAEKERLAKEKAEKERLAKEKAEKERLAKEKAEKEIEHIFDIGTKNYQNGNYKEAFKLYKEAANKGYVLAQYNLGYMYQRGQGVQQNDKKAFKWYKKAANKGYAAAQGSVGFAYQYGKGVRKDYKEALKWNEKASDQDYPIAQYNLGIMYASGFGVEKDMSKSQEMFSKSCANGFKTACMFIKK